LAGKVIEEVENILSGCLIPLIDNTIKSIFISIKHKVQHKLPGVIIFALKHNLPLLAADKNFKEIAGIKSIIREI